MLTKEVFKMRIAYSSMDGEKISGHPGRAKYLVILELDENKKPVSRKVIENPLNHHKEGGREHSGDQRWEVLENEKVEIFITKRCGEGFKENLRKRGIGLILTKENDINDVLKDI